MIMLIDDNGAMRFHRGGADGRGSSVGSSMYCSPRRDSSPRKKRPSECSYKLDVLNGRDTVHLQLGVIL
jgi:hypothetical protein